MKRGKKKKGLLTVLSIIFVIFSIILVIALYSNSRVDSPFKLVKSESTYMLIILLLLVPFLLIFLIIAYKLKGNDVIKVDGDVKGTINQSNMSVGAPLSTGGFQKLDSKKPKGDNKTRFYMLSNIDANRSKYQRGSYNNSINLEELCENFRNFAASRLKLYYDIEDIRKFIAGLAVTKLIILQGMSGTGKTSLAYAFGEFLDNTSTVVPIQPMWKERTDLIGYYNEFTKRFSETTLLKKMYEANYSKDVYITVLDEMNIARIEYYFAEFLSLLELPTPEGRYLDVVSDKWPNDPKLFRNGQIKLPDNMWFIGTANNDDSTFAISDKVYDRAMVLNLDQKAEPFVGKRVKKLHLSKEHFDKLVQDAWKEYEITERNKQRIKALDEYLIKNFNITFGNRIMKQIREYIAVYVACGGDELTAIDDIISKKVLRKLETQNPIYVRSETPAFISFLDELFGVDKMNMCKTYMHKLERNA
jgi:MoxR-like ATPase